MEDKGLEGTEGIESAVQILRDSASYGVSMFPEDGGEWGGAEGVRASDEDGEELGVADLIVRERARKRRKELAEEDEREEEELRLLEENEKKKQKATRKKERARKGKEKDGDPLEPAPPPPRPRPRPRPVVKGSSSISVLTRERSSPTTSLGGQTTDIEVDDSDHFDGPNHSLRLSPTCTDLATGDRGELSTDSNIQINLCSSADDTDCSGAGPNMHRRKKRDRKTNNRNSMHEGSDSDEVVVVSGPSSPTTPPTRRSKHTPQSDVDMESTPLPSRPAKIYNPLDKAKERAREVK